MKPRKAQIDDAWVDGRGLLMMAAGALAFAERWDHSTPGAYAARAQATAHRARIARSPR